MMQFKFITAISIFGVALSGLADSEAGRHKAGTCLGCHGVPSYANVYPSYHVPRLAGQHREYLVSALQAYRSGQRSHRTMIAQAKRLSDQDISDIAAYFSELPSAEGNATMTIPDRVKQAASVCVACHNNDGNSVIPTFPRIAGQREDYLYRSLQDYKSGKRNNPIMLGIVAGLDDDGMKKLARYYSSLPGLGTVSIPKWSD